MKLKNNELINITGGAIKLTAALLNAMSRAASLILGVGQRIGSYVRSRISGKYC